MAKFAHILKGNASSRFPRNICYFDTETTEKAQSSLTHYQTLRLGVACYFREKRKGKAGQEKWFNFTSGKAFWDTLFDYAEKDRTLLVMGYNAGFDFRIVGGFKALEKRGYKPGKLSLLPGCFLLNFHQGRQRVRILDIMNFFTGGLKQWGKMLGLEKGEVEFQDVTDAELLKYCRRDVEILKALWESWREFIRENDFGHFSVTRASQAFNIFKHRFMKTPIYIHTVAEATRLEREAYYGGRVECFHIGQPPGERFYKLDINSMYPFIMRDLPVPVKFKRIREGVDIGKLRRGLVGLGVVAEVRLITRVPFYPIRLKKKLIFPVGEFNTTLCEPELRVALERGHVAEIGRVVVYDKAVIFTDFVNELYELRSKYKAAGNQIYEQMIKYVMNSLYGKFGQRNNPWQYLGFHPRKTDGVYTIDNGMTCETETYYIICGHVWVTTGREEAFDAFPAISAYITSAARVHLLGLMVKAGRQNVFYTDTDSLFVNEAGYKVLEDEIDPEALGKLKVEYETDKLEIRAPKDYATDREDHIKGVKKDAEQIGKNKFSYWEWEGVKGALHTAHHERVFMFKQTKTLERKYDKGQVSSSGSVSPLRLG